MTTFSLCGEMPNESGERFGVRVIIVDLLHALPRGIVPAYVAALRAERLRVGLHVRIEIRRELVADVPLVLVHAPVFDLRKRHELAVDEEIVRVFDVLAEIREQVHDRDGRAAVRIPLALRYKCGEDERFLARRAADRQAVGVERRIVLAC